MQIYIDESGGFQPSDPSQQQPSRWCAVSAIIILDHKHDAVLRVLDSQRESWRIQEIKGRELADHQLARMVTIALGHDVIFTSVLIDMSAHSRQVVADYQHRFVRMFLGNSSECQPLFRKEVENLAERMGRLSGQQFVQLQCQFELVDSMLRSMLLVVAQRWPEELGNIRWVVDAKQRDRVTEFEHLWRTVVLPYIEQSTKLRPTVMIKECDYRPLERYCFMNEPGHPLDIKAVFEDLKFQASEEHLGLQLVDSLGSIMTRGANGRVERRAWANIGRLMYRRLYGTKEPAVYLMALDNAPDPSYTDDFLQFYDCVECKALTPVFRDPPARARP